ncbi:ead/Ea22-like family protein [Enterobacter asburiae]|uniref:ead/Ea22-like family protein n=1 Tax=Enterobacter asburiae TaxID=61645 RepID=UPI003F736A57
MSNIDKQALREAAEKATPGRIGDRIDGSGSIKYQCFGNDGSLVLQTDHKNMEYGFIGGNSEADELFFRLCDPSTVLALLDELEAKDKRIAELEAKLDSADKLQDSAFRHGLQHGFSLGQTDNQAGFEECLSAYGTGKGE